MYTAASTLMHALKARDATKRPTANDTLVAENCSWLVERLTSAAASTPGEFFFIQYDLSPLVKALTFCSASSCYSAGPTFGRSEGTPEQHREATHPLSGQHPLPILFLDRPTTSSPANWQLEQLLPSQYTFVARPARSVARLVFHAAGGDLLAANVLSACV